MKIVECKLHDSVECSNSVEVVTNQDELRLNLNEETLLVFETEPRFRLVCSGVEHQFHQWGSHSYQLWLLDKGLNACLLLKDVNLVQINDGVILVVKKDEKIAIDSLISSYVEDIVSKHGLIILLSKSIRDNYCFKNIVSYSTISDISKCLEKLVNHGS